MVIPTATKGTGFSQQCFVAVENGSVRGGYILYRQAWSIAGERVAVGNAMRPISEGVIARAYRLVGVTLIHHAMRLQPLQFGLGMGGVDEAITKMLRAMRWEIWPIPMYFRVLNGRRFAEEFRPFRSRRALSLLAGGAAHTGLASVAMQAAGLPARWRKRRGVETERVDHFSGWAGDLWQEALHGYSVLPWRDTAVLNDLYAGRPQYFCLKVSEAGRTVGCAVLDQMSTIRTKFGGMRVYTILDCLALPRDAEAVIAAATRFLAGLGADVIPSTKPIPRGGKRFAAPDSFDVRRRSCSPPALNSPGACARPIPRAPPYRRPRSKELRNRARAGVTPAEPPPPHP